MWCFALLQTTMFGVRGLEEYRKRTRLHTASAPSSVGGVVGRFEATAGRKEPNDQLPGDALMVKCASDSQQRSGRRGECTVLRRLDGGARAIAWAGGFAVDAEQFTSLAGLDGLCTPIDHWFPQATSRERRSEQRRKPTRHANVMRPMSGRDSPPSWMPSTARAASALSFTPTCKRPVLESFAAGVKKRFPPRPNAGTDDPTPL
jgi:hypothetical protein